MDTKYAMKISVWSIITNIFLAIIKVVVGIFGASTALVSDGIHSLSDVFSTVAVMIGIVASNQKSDNEHEYGHERIECIVGMYLSAFLIVVGLFIGYEGLIKIINGQSIKIPSVIALYIAVLSVIVKEIMFRITYSAGKKMGSTALMADAWHHRSDAMSSVGSFVGILGARMGYPILDPLCCLIICLLIVKAGIDIGKDSTDKVVDKSCDDETEANMRNTILSVQGVEDLKEIKTRLFGCKIYVDIIIYVNKDLSLYDAHAIAMNVHRNIETTFSNVKHCMVHVDPK